MVAQPQNPELPSKEPDYGCASTLQLGLFTLAFIMGMYVLQLPPYWNVLAFFALEIVLAAAMISNASIMMRSQMRYKQLALPILPLRVFMIRNTYVYFGVLLAWVLILIVYLGSILLPTILLRDIAKTAGAIISLWLVLPFMVFGCYWWFASINIIQAIVDRYVRKNPSFLQTFYDSKHDPLKFSTHAEEMRDVIKIALLWGVVGNIGVSLITYVKVNDLDHSIPTWMGLAFLIGVSLLMFIGYWVYERFFAPSQEEQDAADLAAIAAEYGIDSDEYREWQQMIAEEAQARQQENTTA